MKKLFYFTVLIIITLNSNAQNLLKFTSSGFNPVIVEFDFLTAKDIYKRAYNWTQVYYKDPKQGLKGQIENEFIRVDAVIQDAFITIDGFLKIKNSHAMTYDLTLEFKEGKMKATFVPLKIASVSDNNIYATQNGESIMTIFNKKGEVKKIYQNADIQISKTANNIVGDLINFIKEGQNKW